MDLSTSRISRRVCEPGMDYAREILYGVSLFEDPPMRVKQWVDLAQEDPLGLGTCYLRWGSRTAFRATLLIGYRPASSGAIAVVETPKAGRRVFREPGTVVAVLKEALGT